MDEGTITLPDGWEIVNNRNKEDFYEDYPFLEEIQDFALILIKTKNDHKFQQALENGNADSILKNYPAYVVMKQIDMPNGNPKKMLQKPVKQMKKQVNQTYANAFFVLDEETKFGGNTGYVLDYTVGHMKFKNLFYADGEYIIAVLSTSTKTQKAYQEIEDFYDNLAAVY